MLLSEQSKASPISGSRFGRDVQPFLLQTGKGSLRYGFGCAWLLNWRQPDYDRALHTLQAAWEGGFRYFDTAPRYCRGLSEEVLGRFLACLPRDEFFLATKVSRRPPDNTPAGFRAALENSLELLQTDHIDLYQLHEVRDMEGLLASGVVDTLLRLKEEGLIGGLGLNSNFLPTLLHGLQLDVFDTILSYGRLTPVDDTAARLCPLVSAKGLGMINATPLGSSGLLGGSDPRCLKTFDQEPFLTRGELAVELHDLCRDMGVSILALALQFPLRNPHIDITLTGPSDADMVRSTLAALSADIEEAAWRRLQEWMEETAPRRRAAAAGWSDDCYV